jgi:hypothetical protein
MKKLYIKTTLDAFELPLAVSETAEGLAKMCETTKGTILSEISHSKDRPRVSYKRVDYTDEEWREL